MRDERISLFLEPDEVYLLICHLTRILRRPDYQELKLTDGKRTLTVSGIHPGNATQVPEHLLEVVEKYFEERRGPRPDPEGNSRGRNHGEDLKI